MKKILVIITALFFLVIGVGIGIAFADPYLVCQPQDADGFSYSLDGGVFVDVTYSEQVMSDGNTYAVILDVGFVSVGPHDILVKAFIIDPTWGPLESAAVPFSFVRPGEGDETAYGIHAPVGLGLMKKQ
jgi:hypothetical protein